MDAAKSKVKSFMSKSGQHDTTVHESVAPAVTQENIRRTEHENVTTAVDKEVHQDHYHTSVQPVQHSETLAEQHHSNDMGVEHRSFEHGNDSDIKRRLEEERAQFKDTRTHEEGERTQTMNPTIAGEHRHHHVHENIQPVINKQTVEPHVVHTTVPVHEVHHNAAQHHSASSLPPVSMADFQKQGGSLTGREERSDAFKGEPKSIGGSGGGHSSSGLGTSNTSSTPISDQYSSGSHGTGGTDQFGHMTDGSRNANASSTTSSSTKPSMMDKLNPSKDSTGDGTTGFMK